MWAEDQKQEYQLEGPNSARDLDKCLMHMPVVSPARAATVATHAWTKFHAQIMS